MGIVKKIMLLVILSLILLGCEESPKIVSPKIVREPVVAGSWYPGTQEELSDMVDGFLDNVQKIYPHGRIKAIIVPHAGYIYSGQVAATAFKQLDSSYDNVFLLGPSHRYPLKDLSIAPVTHYKTPLGEVQLSEKVTEMLDEELINSVPEAHQNEHSLEIELPFLQKQLSDLKIIPILIGQVDVSQLKDLLLEYFSDNDLIVVSVDLSHYYPYDEAKQLDDYSIEKMVNLDSEGIMNAEIDALWAVAGLLEISKEKSWKPIMLYYANSGDVTGDKTSVVGYTTIMFVDEKQGGLNKEEQEILLELARDTIELYVREKQVLEPDMDTISKYPMLKEDKGVFVSLDKNGILRGSIGHLLPVQPLYLDVRDNAISAVSRDVRFNPVEPEELNDLHITVSVLDIPTLVKADNWQELLEKLRPNIDGVIIRSGGRQSTYLPQVWASFDTKENFMSRLCIKGGSAADCWKDPKTEVYVYEAQVFSE